MPDKSGTEIPTVFKTLWKSFPQERDSYKGVLDSYEHELTITGSQFDKDRSGALAKVVQDHQAVIEELESQLLALNGGSLPSRERVETVDSSELAKLRSDLVSVQDKLKKVENERDHLQYEMDIRAMRGDYNPTNTKVIHFRYVSILLKEIVNL